MTEKKKNTHGGARRTVDPAKGKAGRHFVSLYACEVEELKSITGEKFLTRAIRELLRRAKEKNPG